MEAGAVQLKLAKPVPLRCHCPVELGPTVQKMLPVLGSVKLIFTEPVVTLNFHM